MPTITCGRCNDNKEQLDEPPMGGPLGQTVAETICSECWTEWQETSARLINHYKLNLSVPDHRKQLRHAMKEFLELEPTQPEPS